MRRSTLFFEMLERRDLLATFVVNSFFDTADRNVGDGICDMDLDDPGEQCTMRAAIEEANATSETDTIHFNLEVTTENTFPFLSPLSQLPTIIMPLIIDGTTQPILVDGTPQPGGRVELNGSRVLFTPIVPGPDVPSGLDITAGNSTVCGLVINGFPGNGIQLRDGGGSFIFGNFIGTGAAGTTALGNGTAFPGQLAGIAITSPNNTIGGVAVDRRNVISGNRGNGIAIIGLTATGNVIEGNLLGTDVTGTKPLGNTGVGVLVNNAKNNTIGGAVSTNPGGNCRGVCNVISGNGQEGIEINLAQDANNIVRGNFIGTDISGAESLGNAMGGIEIIESSRNKIGGPVPAARNVISGNAISGAVAGDSPGIQIFGRNAQHNEIEGNFIGTDTTGTLRIFNGGPGVLINGGASSNSVGIHLSGDVSAACTSTCNLISGNVDGIVISNLGDSEPPRLNQIFANNIGTDVTGTVFVGNAGDGVRIDGGEFTQIGESTSRPNIIAFNTDDGVHVESGTGNHLEFNSIFQNRGLGINLGSDAVTANDVLDVDTGANNQQNFPIITSIDNLSNLNTVVHARLATQPDRLYRVEFYGDDETDETGPNEGRIFMGSVADVRTDAFGVATVSPTLPGSFRFVTATATDQVSGDTSEFSVGFLVVNSLGDAGDSDNSDGSCNTGGTVFSGEPECTLRAAIQQANFNSIKDLITFNLPQPSTLPILLDSELPVIEHPVTIDGLTQPGNHRFGPAGVRIDGHRITDPLASSGFIIHADDTEVRGLSIVNFTGNGVLVDTLTGNITIDRNQFESNGGSGVSVKQGAGVHITQSTFADHNGSLTAGAGLAIDLGGDGVTPNDSAGHDGPNKFQNFPVLLRAISGGLLAVDGILPAPAGQEFRLEFFANEACDPSGHGEGARLVGLETVRTTSEQTRFTGRISSGTEVAPDEFITATATDSAGNTSEFSKCQQVTQPLIFLPGIAGSHLAEQGGEKFWLEPFILNPTIENELSLSPNVPHRSLIASDITRELLGLTTDDTDIYESLLFAFRADGYTEYNFNNDPAKRGPAGCDTEQGDAMPTLFVLPYDWRQDVDVNAARIGEYIACIHQFYPDTKVNLLGHSMGGLVGRRYLLNNPGHHDVHRMVTMGSPWLGAAKASQSLLTGDFFDKAVADLVSRKRLQRLAEFYPGAHELLPSRQYFELGPSSFGEDSFNDFNGNGLTEDEYTYQQFVASLDAQFRGDPATTSQVFHDFPGQDDWRSDRDDTMGVEFLHIVARQAVDVTPERIIATRVVVLSRGVFFGSAHLPTEEVEAFRRLRGPGDGIVPLHSATKRNILGTMDLNSPEACVVVLDGTSGKSDHLLSHQGMTQNTDVHTLALDFFDPNRRAPDPCGNGAAPGGEPEGSVSKPAYYLEVHGGALLTVEDDFGHTVSTSEPFAVADAVPGATLIPLGDRSFLVAVEADQNYTVSFSSTSTLPAFNLDVTREESGTTSQAVRYLDQELAAGGKARIRLTPGGIERLQIDANNDGTFEQTATPTAELNGVASEDIEPPKILADVQTQGTNVIVTISAQDAGSGVQSLFFSLDGSSIQPVTGPITLDPTLMPHVFAFAQDNAANRTGLADIDTRIADLSIAAIGSRDQVAAGNSLNYEFLVTNKGPLDAERVQVALPLPDGATLISLDASQGEVSGDRIVTFALGNLAVGATATVRVAVQAPAFTTTLNAVATVFSPQPDPNRVDNQIILTTDVVVGPNELLSAALTGLVVPAGASADPVITPNGRFIAFTSASDELAPGTVDSNGQNDVFVQSVQDGQLTLVSVNRVGAAASGSSSRPSISADGRFVSFLSDASDLVPGVIDRNGTTDVFVHDLLTGTTRLASATPTGQSSLHGAVLSQSISADGRFVVFTSRAPDLAAGIDDTNNGVDLFVFDLGSGSTKLLTVNAAGNAAGSFNGSGLLAFVISANGQFVAFDGQAGDLVANDTNGMADVFLRDLVANTTTLVSVNAGGTSSANHLSSEPVISADGRFVAFESLANDLVTGVLDDSAGFTFPTNDIFVRDMLSSVTHIVSVNATRNKSGNAPSRDASISADGSKVAFVSNASNLGPGANQPDTPQAFVRDLIAGATTFASVNRNGGAHPAAIVLDAAITADGRSVVFTSNVGDLAPEDILDNADDVYVRNLVTRTTSLVGVTTAGTSCGSSSCSSTSFSASADGQTVAFLSLASNLVNGDSAGDTSPDVFVRNLSDHTTQLVSAKRTVAGGGNILSETSNDVDSLDVSLSGNGKSVAFGSLASNLVPDDSNNSLDVFIRDVAAGTTTPASFRADDTSRGFTRADDSQISVDGRLIVFTSSAPGLLPGANTNTSGGVFVRDRMTGTTSLVSLNAFAPVLSRNGRFVAFLSRAANVTGTPDTNNIEDIFVHDLETGVTELVSVSLAGTAAGTTNGSANPLALSDDGRFVAFSSVTASLDAIVSDTNNAADLFVRDRQNSVTHLVSVNSAGNTARGFDPFSVPALSANGSFISFLSAAADLVSDQSDSNNGPDIFRRNLTTNSTEMVSVNAAATESGNTASSETAMSRDGRFVAFWSFATDILPDLPPGQNLFLRDMQTGTTRLVSTLDSMGAERGRLSFSGDGQFLAFVAQDLTENPILPSQVFLFDQATVTTQQVSRGADGQPGDGASFKPSLSEDGSAVAFFSQATNLSAADVTSQSTQLLLFHNAATPDSKFQFSDVTFRAHEFAGSAAVTITRLFGTSLEASVTFATGDGSARAGDDYTAFSQLVNFAAGETSQTVMLAIADDSLIEGRETLSLQLSNPSGPAQLGVLSSAVLTIDDNELTGHMVERDDLIIRPDAPHIFHYTAVEDGLLTIQTDGPCVTILFCGVSTILEAHDSSGNSFQSTGPTEKRFDIAVTKGATWVIQLSIVTGTGDEAIHDLKLTNVVARRTTPGGDELAIIGSDNHDEIIVGQRTSAFGGLVPTGDLRDIIIRTPDFRQATNYNATTLARLGAAPFVAIRALRLTSNDGITVDPSVTAPLRLELDSTNDSAITRQNEPIKIAVLDNDDFGLSVSTVMDPPHGSVDINGDGTVTYTPDDEFFGTEIFPYEVTDGVSTGTATVTVTVTPFNHPPTSIRVSNATIIERISGESVGTLSAVDTDAGQTQTFAVADPRFEVVGSILRLKSDQFLDRNDGITVSVDVSATDSGAPSQTFTQMIVLNLATNPRPWQNPFEALDTDNDAAHVIAPIDALLIINLLNNPGTLLGAGGSLPPSRPAGTNLAYFDTDGDGFAAAVDVLLVINFLNGRSGGEGEFLRKEFARKTAFPFSKLDTPRECTAPTRLSAPAAMVCKRAGRRIAEDSPPKSIDRVAQRARELEDVLGDIATDVAWMHPVLDRQ